MFSLSRMGQVAILFERSSANFCFEKESTFVIPIYIMKDFEKNSLNKKKCFSSVKLILNNRCPTHALNGEDLNKRGYFNIISRVHMYLTWRKENSMAYSCLEPLGYGKEHLSLYKTEDAVLWHQLWAAHWGWCPSTGFKSEKEGFSLDSVTLL